MALGSLYAYTCTDILCIYIYIYIHLSIYIYKYIINACNIYIYEPHRRTSWACRRSLPWHWAVPRWGTSGRSTRRIRRLPAWREASARRPGRSWGLRKDNEKCAQENSGQLYIFYVCIYTTHTSTYTYTYIHIWYTAMACMKGSICAAPSAQLRPTKDNEGCAQENSGQLYILYVCIYTTHTSTYINIHIYTCVYSDGLHEGEHLRGPQGAVEAQGRQRRMCSRGLIAQSRVSFRGHTRSAWKVVVELSGRFVPMQIGLECATKT